MTIVDGQIETLRELKESLSRRGITRFSSVGEIRRFLNDFEAAKQQLPSRVEFELEEELQGMRSTLVDRQQSYDELRTGIRKEIENQLSELDAESERVSDKRKNSALYRVLYFFKIRSLSRRASRLRSNFEKLVDSKTDAEKGAITTLEDQISEFLKNRKQLSSERLGKSVDELDRTKKIVDGLYPLIAGAIGEAAVVKELRQLSDDYYLINDFSMDFNPPIYNKKERDRIFSIQIDHLLIGPSGVFVLETKNWSRASVQNLDLRSPVNQILRTSFALFVLLNSNSRLNDIRLESHHWGAKKIPIRNIIVMINEKPKEEFKHVKVLSLTELVGYVRYFDRSLESPEVASIFECLRKKS